MASISTVKRKNPYTYILCYTTLRSLTNATLSITFKSCAATTAEGKLLVPGVQQEV